MDPEEILTHELLDAPSETMQQYLAHFADGAREFIAQLAPAIPVWQHYYDQSVAVEPQHPEFAVSGAYALFAINAALVSVRLFLSGYLTASGNQARQALESLAFSILVASRDTGAHGRWVKGHASEHKALEYLLRNAARCGVSKANAAQLQQQTQWFDVFSHPSKAALATIWRESEKRWYVGAIFNEDHLKEYRQEMTNRISLAKLLHYSLRGLHVQGVRQGKLPRRGVDRTRQIRASRLG
jgi:hypothetical protein